MAASSSTVRQVAQVFALLTTTVRASTATWSSAYSMPAASHAAASSSLMEREASLASVSPRQNFSNPPPVPEEPTVTCTPGLAAMKSSAARAVRG